MAYELVQTRIPYKQVFRYPKPKRKPWCNWFGEIVALRIEVVDPEEAPVAYEVRFGPDDAPRLLGYQIRSYQGGLWWPMGGDFNYVLHPESFATAMNDGHPQTLVLLDPSFAGCTERRPLSAFPEQYSRVDHDSNNLANQQALAQRGASTTIFCAEGTYVRAGEPIFYAVPDDGENRKSVSIVVGISDPKRETDCTSLSGPGPIGCRARTVASHFARPIGRHRRPLRGHVRFRNRRMRTESAVVGAEARCSLIRGYSLIRLAQK